MAYRSGFFNAVENDRLYNAEDMSNYYEGLITDGVYKEVDDALAVSAGTGLSVQVGLGRAILDCHWIRNSSVLTLSLDTAEVLVSRTDLIVVKLDKSVSAREVTIEVIKNAAVPPDDTENIRYLLLARVTIPANASSISQSNIEDMRGTKYCYYVHGLVEQISTDTLFTQYKRAFEDWFSTLQSDLKVDTYIQNYRNSYTIADASTGKYSIGISEFSKTVDVLFVFVNGMLMKNDEYSIENDGENADVVFTNGMEAGNDLEFIVLKSRIGSSTEGVNTNA